MPARRQLAAACVLALTTALQAPLRVRQSRALHAAPVEPPQTIETDCLVVGGGISGCTLAHNLKKNGIGCLLAEQRDYLGGNVKSHTTEDGFTWEEGPNSYQPGDPILTLACDAGMKDDILLADPNSDRFVLWDGELRALPKDIPTAVLGTFLTWPGKIRAGLGAMVVGLWQAGPRGGRLVPRRCRGFGRHPPLWGARARQKLQEIKGETPEAAAPAQQWSKTAIPASQSAGNPRGCSRRGSAPSG